MSQKILLDKINVPGIKTYEVYRQNGGYASVEKALKTLTPDEVVEEVKKSFILTEEKKNLKRNGNIISDGNSKFVKVDGEVFCIETGGKDISDFEFENENLKKRISELEKKIDDIQKSIE